MVWVGNGSRVVDDVYIDEKKLEHILGAVQGTQSESRWSKEAIFALLGLLATVVCFVLGLVLPHLRRWWKRSKKYDVENDVDLKLQHIEYDWRLREDARRKQQEEYSAIVKMRRGGF